MPIGLNRPGDFRNGTPITLPHEFGNPAGTGASGGGSSIDLQTDGVSNTDQTVLNLISGNGVTLTADGSGGVTIDGVALETDGTPNGSQTLLNLVAGTNITLTDDGLGGVTIDSSASYATTVGDGVTTTFMIAHNLDSSDVIVQVYDIASGEVSLVEVSVTGANTVSVTFADPPSSSSYRIVVLSSGGVQTIATLPTGPTIQYVATTGSDTTGNGTSGSPWKTIAKALSLVPQLLNQNYTINIADGTYAEGITTVTRTSLGSNTLSFIGNSGSMDNVVISGTVPYAGSRGRADGDATVFISGEINVKFIGIKLASSASDFDFYLREGVNAVVQNFHAASATLTAIEVEDDSYIQMVDTITMDAATGIGLEIAWSSRCAFFNTGSASTITITGPGVVTAFIGIQITYNSQANIPSALNSNVTIAISNVKIGIQLGLQASFQMYYYPSTLSIVNASTPSGSQAVLATDQSSYSTRNTTVWTHFSTGFLGNSLAYGEHDSTGGTLTLNSLGATSSVSLGAVWTAF